jgi:hypothetical protein
MKAERGVLALGAVRSGWGWTPSYRRTSENAYLLRASVNKGKKKMARRPKAPTRYSTVRCLSSP